MNFSERVYKTVSRIPKGRVMSYGQVAFLSGGPGAARAVGRLMAKNPRPGSGAGRVPCHRVVKSDGFIGGFSGKGGISEKRSLLEGEGIRFEKDKIIKEFFV
jgi:O-6-methylguanine DNA methyltransferase